MVGTLEELGEKLWWVGEHPHASLPAQPEGCGTVDCWGLSCPRMGTGVLSCECPHRGKCSINPPGVRCWSNLDPPHSAPGPCGSLAPGTEEETPCWGHFNGGVGFCFRFLPLFIFLMITGCVGPTARPALPSVWSWPACPPLCSCR